MKSINIIILTITLFSFNIIFAQSNLLAPVYQGSVKSPLRSDKTQLVFLSKDPINKVKSFYSNKVGKLTNKDPLTNSFFLPNLGNTPVVSYAKTIMTSNQISRQEGYPDPDAKDVGVLLIEKKLSKQSTSNTSQEGITPSAGNSEAVNKMMKKINQLQKQLMKEEGGQAYSKEDMTINGMSDFFSGFKNDINLHHHPKKELIALYNKYKFLDTSFFPLVKDKSGDKISYANQLLNQYKNKIGNSVYERDTWNYWLGFLKKLAAHAYRTCIVINTKPSTWHK